MSISGLSILFHLFLYLYSSANTTQLWLLYVLKSSRMIPLTILFFSKLFRNSSSYVFPFKFKIILSISTKKLSEILIGVPLNLYIDLGRINPEEGNGNPLQYSCLEWIAMLFPRGSSRPRDWTLVSGMSCIGRQVVYHQRHLGSPFWVIQMVYFILDELW